MDAWVNRKPVVLLEHGGHMLPAAGLNEEAGSSVLDALSFLGS